MLISKYYLHPPSNNFDECNVLFYELKLQKEMTLEIIWINKKLEARPSPAKGNFKKEVKVEVKPIAFNEFLKSLK